MQRGGKEEAPTQPTSRRGISVAIKRLSKQKGKKGGGGGIKKFWPVWRRGVKERFFSRVNGFLI